MTDNALATFGGGTGLISREEMAAYLNTATQTLPQGSGGKQFLKISDKDGAWTFGAEETVVEEDSLWAIHPTSFFHGYIVTANKDGSIPLNAKVVCMATMANEKLMRMLIEQANHQAMEWK